MKDDDVRLEKDDVAVVQIDEECGECTGSMPSQFFVVVDFRSAGLTQHLGPYCEACATTLAERIRDGLPSAESDEAAS